MQITKKKKIRKAKGIVDRSLNFKSILQMHLGYDTAGDRKLCDFLILFNTRKRYNQFSEVSKLEQRKF